MRYLGRMSQTATQARSRTYQPVPKIARTKGAMGRPTDFAEEKVAEAAELALQGLTEAEIAKRMGIDRVTLYRWRMLHENLRNTLKGAKDAADDRVELSMYQKAMGYDFVEQQAIKVKLNKDVEGVEVVEVVRHQPADTTAGIFWLKNRRREGWTDTQRIDLNGSLQIEDAGSRDLALALIGILRTAGSDEAQPVTIDHQPAQDTPEAPVAQERRRRAFE